MVFTPLVEVIQIQAFPFPEDYCNNQMLGYSAGVGGTIWMFEISQITRPRLIKSGVAIIWAQEPHREFWWVVTGRITPSPPCHNNSAKLPMWDGTMSGLGVVFRSKTVWQGQDHAVAPALFGCVWGGDYASMWWGVRAAWALGSYNSVVHWKKSIWGVFKSSACSLHIAKPILSIAPPFIRPMKMFGNGALP